MTTIMTGKEWIALNDPTYVAPQKKAARTRAIPMDLHRLSEVLSQGSVSVKVGGVWKQATPIAFGGDSENTSLEAIDTKANPERDIAMSKMEIDYKFRAESTSKGMTKAQRRKLKKSRR